MDCHVSSEAMGDSLTLRILSRPDCVRRTMSGIYCQNGDCKARTYSIRQLYLAFQLIVLVVLLFIIVVDDLKARISFQHRLNLFERLEVERYDASEV